jgi:hypothetical protein
MKHTLYIFIFILLCLVFVSYKEQFDLKYFTKPVPKLKPFIPIEQTIQERKNN